MQEALPYKRWDALPSAPPETTAGGGDTVLERLVKENPVIVIGRRGCCMCHVVRKLLLGLGVNPPVFEVDGEVSEGSLVKSLPSSSSSSKDNNNNGNNIKNNNNNNKLLISGCSSNNSLQFPLVFVGGELFGGLDKIMATHLSGELVPILRQAGALWL